MTNRLYILELEIEQPVNLSAKTEEVSWLLTQVRFMTNRLYILELEIEQPVNLSAKTEEVSWRWHARYGHLNFQALQKLHREEMVSHWSSCTTISAGR